MDPVASAASLVAISIQVVKLLQQTAETIRDAKNSLVRLLSQTERIRLFLEQLQTFARQLGPRAGILLTFNDSGPRKTMEELYVFVQSITQKQMWIRVRVLLNQRTANDFVKRLHRHEEEIMQMLLAVAALVPNYVLMGSETKALLQISRHQNRG